MRTRLTITLKDSVVRRVDRYVDGSRIRNRSHAIEYLLNKSLYASQTQAVILAGGTGLGMRPIKQKPLLEYQITRLRDAGVHDIILCVGERGEEIEKYFGKGERFNVTITYCRDGKKGLGTGGALQHAKKYIGSSPFLVLYGDVYTDIDIKDLLSFHVQHGEIVTMVLKSLREVKQYGQITMRGTKVTGFGRSNLVNAGIYVCNQEVFEYMPATEVFQFETILEDLIRKQVVDGYVYDGIWFDVGTPEEYELAIKATV
ncbi:hypothetical protein COU89_01470 [Candidatus Roizmanbacteria bacterium CG10_big_fil_rev_8_21_14_0_10_45_7]|uniref:Nucleotidyl transferase domain-containing protein n=1 Tax=Candidatus Roizmanbacteria bacterium CG10_big_fil_rev_8_21_14_0_10_45_7 TaxID=1974854 RepID=A0A2M8KV40_9BACT|nr:MAG: hypothetical protein COU89_01470 [Candidatus Roizmanbacteria bacterium CG10_big_fil_rev_8_21_14_0_10_45_7]